MRGHWIDPQIRDQVVDFIGYWRIQTGFRIKLFLGWLGLSASQYHRWKGRYGQTNQHNAPVPRDFWLAVWEKEAIRAFQIQHSQEGYRRLTFMMLDQDIVAVSPSSVYRVLKEAGQLQRWDRKPSKKGTGFDQPSAPHEHWHIDISYLCVFR